MPEFRDQPQILSVSELNRYVKGRLDSDAYLGSVAVRGELSNYKKQGHHYFSLKDGKGVLSCIMYANATRTLRFNPVDGMQVIVFGRVSVFWQGGKYQLYVDMMAPDGAGAANAAFEKLYAQLEKEGLLAPERKKPLPQYPQNIALITSPDGDAIKDLVRILRDRWPLAKIKVMGVRVQGPRAAAEMTGAVLYANRHQLADVLIIGRGGGSTEDLWAFNDEKLARAIASSSIPIITAIGHTADATIADYVADLRVVTPTHAAQSAVPDQLEVQQSLQQSTLRITKAMRDCLQHQQRGLQRLTSAQVFTHPLRIVQERREEIDYLQEKLSIALERNAAVHRRKLVELCAKLDSLSPLRVLSRGYGLTQAEDGSVIVSVTQAEVGSHISVTLSDGKLNCIVTERELNSHG
jgi:exodeoxyribonuclease VII large subunit